MEERQDMGHYEIDTEEHRRMVAHIMALRAKLHEAQVKEIDELTMRKLPQRKQR